MKYHNCGGIICKAVGIDYCDICSAFSYHADNDNEGINCKLPNGISLIANQEAFNKGDRESPVRDDIQAQTLSKQLKQASKRIKRIPIWPK